MTTHKTGTLKEWLAARLDLRKAEKELTRRSDELAKRRQGRPWVSNRQAVSLRDRRGERLPGRPLRCSWGGEALLSNANRVMAGTAGRAGGGERCVLYV